MLLDELVNDLELFEQSGPLIGGAINAGGLEDKGGQVKVIDELRFEQLIELPGPEVFRGNGRNGTLPPLFADRFNSIPYLVFFALFARLAGVGEAGLGVDDELGELGFFFDSSRRLMMPSFWASSTACS